MKDEAWQLHIGAGDLVIGQVQIVHHIDPFRPKNYGTIQKSCNFRVGLLKVASIDSMVEQTLLVVLARSSSFCFVCVCLLSLSTGLLFWQAFHMLVHAKHDQQLSAHRYSLAPTSAFT